MVRAKAKTDDAASRPTWPMWQGWIDSGHVADHPDVEHPVSVQGTGHEGWDTTTYPPTAITRTLNAPLYVTIEYIERLALRIFPLPRKAKDRANYVSLIDRLKGGEVVRSLFNEYRWVG